VKTPTSNALALSLHDFFDRYLPQLRVMSAHTLHSYRDSLKLLLTFVAARRKKDVAGLGFDDIGPSEVIGFLQYLENARHNIPATINVRLAGIHSFFRFAASSHPDMLDQAQRILGIPFKRAPLPVVEYLESEEIEAVLATIDRKTVDGRRDYTLLATMFNTGGRVQEILDLRPYDLKLEKPHHVRLFGKGRKERLCPIWTQTAELLKAFLSERKIEPASRDLLFCNHRGRPLTRFGVRYILNKYCRRAKQNVPALAAKRLHPHSVRHSTAVHLLQSGVDMTTISNWLGHASIDTTNRYATVDLKMKRAALAKADPVGNKPRGSASWRRNVNILDWLESL
jgi:integrase/recombinase XerD